jgi:biotin carboxyl carrier protein
MHQRITKYIATGILSVLIITGCHQAANNSEKTTPSAIPVTVTPLRTGPMSSYLELSGTSTFLFKAAVKAPVTGYIENMFISQGDAVVNNNRLFTIKTKEASAITNDSINALKFKGLIDVKAAVAGLISSIDHPKGDYVAEGDQLCQIAVPESFVFILDIPFELSGSLKLNTWCEIVLPDGHSLQGVIKSRFPSMTGSSQTERFIVKLSESASLPENLIAKIKIIKESADKTVSLPKSSILTDETMKSFWVMKLINDSIAVKVPVITGISEKEYVQIKMPIFKDTDLFLSSGNFGLGDTANVKVIKTLGHGQ